MTKQKEMISQTTTEIVDGQEVFRAVPVPDISTFPVFSWKSLFPLSSAKIPSMFQGTRPRYFVAARYALSQALQEIGAKPGDEILVPAYHCMAMIYPLLDAGCSPVFFKIKSDFSADIQDIESKITSKTKAIIAVNYFGFFQNITAVKDICDVHGLPLIEDCAHALFGHQHNINVGQTGDYAIGSTKKFFPVQQGGILIQKKEFSTLTPLKKNSFKDEIRFLNNLIERSIERGRLWPLNWPYKILHKLRPEPVKNLQRQLKNTLGTDHIPNATEYSAAQGSTSPVRLSLLVEKLSSPHRIYLQRRNNYAALVNLLSDIPDLEIPLRDLPPGTVPYMVPVIINTLEEVFPAIEDAALPFQRFGQFLHQGAEICSTSARYAKTIIQLPCHQELTDNEIKSIAEKLRRVMGHTKCQ